MALEIQQRIDDDLEGARYRAKDTENGQAVGVYVSHEALQDYGEEACLNVAQTKYDGSIPVRVTKADFDA